jgi:hypothetical protein
LIVLIAVSIPLTACRQQKRKGDCATGTLRRCVCPDGVPSTDWCDDERWLGCTCPLNASDAGGD